MDRLVSIIIPVYNAEKFIIQSVESALDQSHRKVEVIVVDDGSTDRSWEILNDHFSDSRLILLRQENKGVSAARNKALEYMKGDYFSFLDADDVYPPDAIAARLKLFCEDDRLSFVDGHVIYSDDQMRPTGQVFKPSLKGDPLPGLLKLSPSCLFGPSWMIKRESGIQYRFDERLTHAEDLYFYLSICLQKKSCYSFVELPVLYYRVGHVSAMSNLMGLEKGYHRVLRNLIACGKVSLVDRLSFRLRIMKIMFLSHLFDGRDIKNAVFSVFRLSQ